VAEVLFVDSVAAAVDELPSIVLSLFVRPHTIGVVRVEVFVERKREID